MFFFTYLPQAAILALFNGPLAAVSAALLVLSESSTVFNVMARALLVEDSLIDTFDGVSINPYSTLFNSRLTSSIDSRGQRRDFPRLARPTDQVGRKPHCSPWKDGRQTLCQIYA